jgi:hypothetical protein
MDPRNLFLDLCRQYGLSENEALGFEPLVRRAMELPLERREKLMALVQAGLARKAGELRERRRQEELVQERCLKAVAAILHDWNVAGPPS